jgi:hypothetical protein
MNTKPGGPYLTHRQCLRSFTNQSI